MKEQPKVPDEAQTPPEGAIHARTVPETILLWLAKVVAAGILGSAAVRKLVGEAHTVELFRTIGMGDAGRYLIGGLEILAAILILIPHSAIYGSFLGIGIMCGAIIGHVTVIGLAGIHLALLVFLCCLTVLYIRRHDASFIHNLWDR